MEKRKERIQKKISWREIFLSKKNLKRDIIIVTLAIIFSALFIINNLPSASRKNQRVLSESVVENISEQEIKNENEPENLCIGAPSNPLEVLMETKQETKEPKPLNYEPKITASKPAAETKRDGQGRQTCAKEHDKPSKSKRHRGRNMDMECCLDPDEYPNPWCYYPPEKYGKLLDKLK